MFDIYLFVTEMLILVVVYLLKWQPSESAIGEKFEASLWKLS